MLLSIPNLLGLPLFACSRLYVMSSFLISMKNFTLTLLFIKYFYFILTFSNMIVFYPSFIQEYNFWKLNWNSSWTPIVQFNFNGLNICYVAQENCRQGCKSWIFCGGSWLLPWGTLQSGECEQAFQSLVKRSWPGKFLLHDNCLFIIIIKQEKYLFLFFKSQC